MNFNGDYSFNYLKKESQTFNVICKAYGWNKNDKDSIKEYMEVDKNAVIDLIYKTDIVIYLIYPDPNKITISGGFTKKENLSQITNHVNWIASSLYEYLYIEKGMKKEDCDYVLKQQFQYTYTPIDPTIDLPYGVNSLYGSSLNINAKRDWRAKKELVENLKVWKKTKDPKSLKKSLEHGDHFEAKIYNAN